ncbi:DUF4158 domain-containing protein [Shimazuella sp. AN120528]|nr:DUF4158 domain-containing protein [Shimazuella soli]
MTWVKEKARNPFSQLGFLILLKTFQCLNHFVPISDVPKVILKHIAKEASLDLPKPNMTRVYPPLFWPSSK